MTIWIQLCVLQIHAPNPSKGRHISYVLQLSSSASMCTTFGFIEWVVHPLLSMDRLRRTGINRTHVYSNKRRTNSKRGEVQAVCSAVVHLCTVFFVVITTAHMAAHCGHAECGSRSLLLRVLIETVHNVSTCFFWDYLHTLVLQLDSKYSNASVSGLTNVCVFYGKYSGVKKMSKYTFHSCVCKRNSLFRCQGQGLSSVFFFEWASQCLQMGLLYLYSH